MLALIILIFMLISLQSLFYLSLDIWSYFWRKLPAKLNNCSIVMNESKVISNHTLYTLKLEYEYELGEKSYRSNRVGITGRYTSKSLAQVERMKSSIENDVLFVYVCPLANHYAIVKRGVVNRGFLYFGFLLGIFLITLTMYVQTSLAV